MYCVFYMINKLSVNKRIILYNFNKFNLYLLKKKKFILNLKKNSIKNKKIIYNIINY